MHSDHCAGRRWAGPGWLLVGLGLLLAACGHVPPPAPLPGPLPVQPASVTAAQSAEAPGLRIEAGRHTAPIRRIDVDAAERFVVTASDEKTARVWDLASGALLQVLRPPIGAGDEGRLYAVAITPDGSTVATAGLTGWDSDGTASIYLFEPASGRLRQRLPGLPNVILHLAFSPEGRFLAAALGSDGIRTYALRTATEVARDSDYGADSYWVEFDGLPSGISMMLSRPRMAITSLTKTKLAIPYVNYENALACQTSGTGTARTAAPPAQQLRGRGLEHGALLQALRTALQYYGGRPLSVRRRGDRPVAPTSQAQTPSVTAAPRCMPVLGPLGKWLSTQSWNAWNSRRRISPPTTPTLHHWDPWARLLMA